MYASYAISHKEPVRNNFENYYADAKMSESLGRDGSISMPKAERLNDLEAGYKYQSSQFSAGVNFYYMNYKDQFVLTGEIDNIGEAITRNLDKSYRMGAELEASWQPVDWFQWDANATWSKNRVKDLTIQQEDGSDYTIAGRAPEFLSRLYLQQHPDLQPCRLQGKHPEPVCQRPEPDQHRFQGDDVQRQVER